MTAPTADERLARLEDATEATAREISAIKAEIRELRATIRRNFLIIMGVLVATWLATISLLLVVLFIM